MHSRAPGLLFCLGTALCAEICPGTVSSLAQMTARSSSQSIVGMDFDLTGTALTGTDTPMPGWFFNDGTGGAEILDEFSDHAKVWAGDRVRLRGTFILGRDNALTLHATQTEILGHGEIPEPVDVGGRDISNGNCNFRFVRVRGVIASVALDEIDPRYVTAILRTESGPVIFDCLDTASFPFFNKLIDAEVEINGLATPITGWRRNLGSLVRTISTNAVTVLSPAPDPFAAATLTDAAGTHRQRLSGTVVACGSGRFYLRDQTGRTLAVHPARQATMPDSGSAVTVSGFSELDPFHLRLTEALIRVDSPSAHRFDVIDETQADELFTSDDGQNKVNTAFNGRLVRLRGTVTFHHDLADEIMLECGTRQVFVELAAIRSRLAGLPTKGCTVDVTGLCVAEFERLGPAFSFPNFRRFTLLPRSVEDVRILARPPWWTPARLLTLVGALLSIIVGILVWNIALKRKSERRGRELYEEKIDHALAEQKVEERTRLAVELHDSVSQTLTGIALQLDGGEVETAKTMLASCRGELRRCLWDLRSRTFEEKDMTEAVSRTITPHLNGVEATVRFNVPRERLSESLTHAILRIIRELVVNAIRHGQAKHIRIAGEMHENTVSFSVADNGRGFDPETAPGPEQGHFGLLGIRERIEDFNGALQIASAPGKGAKFTVTLLATDETNEH